MINEEQLKKHYREIEKTCIKTKTLIPTLIERYYPKEISAKYQLSYKEKQELLTQNIIKELTIKQVEKRADEIKKYNTLEQLHKDELNDFLKKNPQFKIIIKKIE